MAQLPVIHLQIRLRHLDTPLTRSAVLTGFAALWTRIEYCTKQLAPWQQMSKGFASPEQSVLLDYLSPWNVLALPKACKLQHYGVVIAISGSLLTQLLIVISTGLFVTQDQVFQRYSDSPTRVFRLPGDFSPSTVGIRPQINLYGISGTTEYPIGSTDQYAFQPFHLPHNISLGMWPYSVPASTFRLLINVQPGALTQLSSMCFRLIWIASLQ